METHGKYSQCFFFLNVQTEHITINVNEIFARMCAFFFFGIKCPLEYTLRNNIANNEMRTLCR